MRTSTVRVHRPSVGQTATTCVLAIIMWLLQGCSSNFGAVLGFSDVPVDHPNAEAITDLANRGIVSGYEDGRFRPDNPVARQQFAKMIVLAMGFTVTNQDSHVFRDVSHSSSTLYPYHFVTVAAKNGLIMGYDDGSFRPLDHITRMELITIMARMAAPLLQEPPGDWQGSLDTSDITHGKNTRWVEYSGLLRGVGNLASWDTKKAATRGEVAQILDNLLVATAYRPPLSISNYGARGDGVGDDTWAIQRAIDACPAGGVVSMPPGTYIVSSSVSLQSNITLEGTTASVVTGAGSQVLELSHVKNVTLDGFTIVGDYGRRGQRGIGFTGGASNIIMRNLTIHDAGFCGIYSDGGVLMNVTVSGCTITHCGQFGLHFQNSNGGYSSENVLIENSKFLDFNDLEGYPSHGIYLKVARGVTIRNVECGITRGVGTHSSFSICDVEDAVLENCVGHDSAIGIAINRYPSAGCRNITIRNSGGYNNSKCDRFEYMTNYNIVWDATCYGTYEVYKR